MNTIRYGWLAVLTLVGVLHGSGAWTADGVEIIPADKVTKDLVQATARGEVKVLPGKIVNDTWQKVEVRLPNNKEQEVPRGAVEYLYFENADNAAYVAGLRAMKERSWQQAYQAFVQAAKSAENLPEDQREFFERTVQYYMGECLLNMGRYDQAKEALDAALRDRMSGWKLQGEFALARVQEGKGDYKGAEGRYGRLAGTLYPEMAKDAPWAERWIVLARLGEQRTKVMQAIRASGQGSAVKAAIDATMSLAKENRELFAAEPEAQQDVVRIQALGLQYLGQEGDPAAYEELFEFVKEPIQAAVQKNEDELLGALYLARADAYYGLSQSASDEAIKTENAGRALMEYLRVALSFDVPRDDIARAYFRIGELFETLKGEDWQKRARMYYTRAASNTYKGVEPYNSEAQKALKALAQ